MSDLSLYIMIFLLLVPPLCLACTREHTLTLWAVNFGWQLCVVGIMLLIQTGSIVASVLMISIGAIGVLQFPRMKKIKRKNNR